MDAQLYPEAALWHYIVVFALSFILGFLNHVGRAVFNLYPDRLSDRPMMDMMISDGYNLGDRLFGVEYDENGYYDLDSAKNLKIMIWLTVAFNLGIMVFIPGMSGLIGHGLDLALAWLVELFKYRLETVELI